MKNSVRRILSVALMLLFACYSASATLFVHSHLIDGEQIVHSHPLFGGDGASHTHSSAEARLIAALTDVVLVSVATVVVVAAAVHLLRVVVSPYLAHFEFFEGLSRSLRAPPVAFFAA